MKQHLTRFFRSPAGAWLLGKLLGTALFLLLLTLLGACATTSGAQRPPRRPPKTLEEAQRWVEQARHRRYYTPRRQ